MQVATQGSAYKLLESPLESGEEFSQDALQAISTHLGVDFSSFQLKRKYAGPAVHIYSATSTEALSANDLCAAITTAAGGLYLTVGQVDNPLCYQPNRLMTEG